MLLTLKLIYLPLCPICETLGGPAGVPPKHRRGGCSNWLTYVEKQSLFVWGCDAWCLMPWGWGIYFGSLNFGSLHSRYVAFALLLISTHTSPRWARYKQGTGRVLGSPWIRNTRTTLHYVLHAA